MRYLFEYSAKWIKLSRGDTNATFHNHPLQNRQKHRAQKSQVCGPIMIQKFVMVPFSVLSPNFFANNSR